MTRKEKKWQHWQEKIELIMRRPNNIKTVKSFGVSPVCMQMLLKIGGTCGAKRGKVRLLGRWGTTVLL